MDLPLFLKGTRNHLQWRPSTLEYLTPFKCSCILSYIHGLSQPFLASLWACFFDLTAWFSTPTSSTVKPNTNCYICLILIYFNQAQNESQEHQRKQDTMDKELKVSLSTTRCGKCTYFILFHKLKMATQLETQQSKRSLYALTGGTSRGWEKHNISQKTVSAYTAVSYMSYNLT